MTTESLPPGVRVHLMGIGGFGINPIARVLHELGYVVSGCDMNESPLIPPLRTLGIPIEIGHDATHLAQFKPDALVISSAIPAHNVEVEAAHEHGLPVFKRADILCALMRDRVGVAVAGTHGKTTTTAMLSWVLTACGLDPSFIIGGVPANLGTNAHAGAGQPFVIEADEYDRMFMGLCPQIEIVTTLEMDHPDMFASLDDVRALFGEFVGLLPTDGLLIAGADAPEVCQLAEGHPGPVTTYGLSGGDWQAVGLTVNNQGGTDFRVLHHGKSVTETSLQAPGTHNVANALAALAAAEALGAPLDAAANALGEFQGVGRRFEVRGQACGVTVIDDYAHHPTAIRATLQAAHARYEDASLWAVWQPHTYRRTKELLGDFATSFGEADHVIITDVYRSRDTQTYGVSPDDVVTRMADHPDVRHVGPLDAVVDALADGVQPGDVVIVMSAGDATRIAGELLARLETNIA